MLSLLGPLLALDVLGGCSSGAPAATNDTVPAEGGATAGGSGSTAGGATDMPVAPDCPEGVSPNVFARLEDPDGPLEVSPARGESQTIELSGTLSLVSAEVDACAGCTSEGKPVLRIELDTEGADTWAVVLSVGERAPIVEALEPLAGQPVTLSFRYGQGFQFRASSGLLLSDATGLVLAAECGPFVQALTESPWDFRGPDSTETVAEFTVAKEAPICVRQATTSCGPDWVYTELDFRGDTTTTVGLSEDGEFMLDGLAYGARNLGAGYPDNAQCSDFEGASEWLVWRKVP